MVRERLIEIDTQLAFAGKRARDLVVRAQPLESATGFRLALRIRAGGQIAWRRTGVKPAAQSFVEPANDPDVIAGLPPPLLHAFIEIERERHTVNACLSLLRHERQTLRRWLSRRAWLQRIVKSSRPVI